MALLRSLLSLWVLLLLLTSTTLVNAQSEYKYSYMPKKVYENQLFPVTIICVAECSKKVPNFKFDSVSNIQPLSEKPLVIYNGDDSFYTFYFKASEIDIRIPRLFINNETGDFSLESQTVSLASLKNRDDFCHVLAADMKIQNSQVSNYDEKNYLLILNVDAYEANIEDIDIQNVIETGIENIHRENAKVEAEVYVVLPVTQKELKFTYFNTIKKQYVFLKIPVELLDISVTTQSDLNPKEDSFELLKKYTFMIFLGFFFLMFLFKRDFFYLILGVISLITLLTFYIPHKKVCIKQGAPLFILPTETSTISTKIDKELHTMLLGAHEKYKKVEYKHGIIGWIRDEDVCEN